MSEKNFNNNNGQINIAKDDSNINSEYFDGSKYNVSNNNIGILSNNTKIIYNFPKIFDPNKKIMQTNLAMLSENFTGREKYIKEIECLLTNQRVITICGNGGIGKTQIVLKYIELYKEKYNSIAFVNAFNSDTLISDYAKYLNIDNDENTISNMRHWTNINKDWLFIFDNVDNENLKANFRKNYMVDPTNGHIIITSRLKNWDKKISLDLFSEDESIKFLEKKTKLNDLENSRLLSKELGNFPLALEQAGAYIKSGSSYQEYIELYRDDKYKLHILDDKQPDEYHSTIVKTWNISINRILNQASKDLLNIISFFAPNNIPIRIFDEGKIYLPNSIKNIIEDKFNCKKMYEYLDRYSLIIYDKGFISIHKLLQEVIKLQINQNKWYIYAFNLLYNSFNYDYNKQNTWENCIEIISHVLNIIEYTNEKSLEIVNTAYLFNKLAIIYYYQGKYEETETLYFKALKIREKVLGLNHPDTAESYHDLALLYKTQGKYEKAETLYLKALKIREDVLDLNHPDIAISYNDLALLYKSQGKYEETETLYLKALKIRKKVLGLNHPYTALSYNNLAALYNKQGKYEESETLYLKALKIYEEILGLNHPYTALSYNGLALLYYNQVKYEKAETLHLKALKIREDVLGLNHPDTASSYNNLAGLYKSQEKYEEAETLYLKALKIYEEVLGLKHPSTKTVRENLNDFLQNKK